MKKSVCKGVAGLVAVMVLIGASQVSAQNRNFRRLGEAIMNQIPNKGQMQLAPKYSPKQSGHLQLGPKQISPSPLGPKHHGQMQLAPKYGPKQNGKIQFRPQQNGKNPNSPKNGQKPNSQKQNGSNKGQKQHGWKQFIPRNLGHNHRGHQHHWKKRNVVPRHPRLIDPVGPTSLKLPRFGFSSYLIRGHGLRVSRVDHDGLAWQIGLQRGDVILKLNHYRLTYGVAWEEALRDAVENHGGWVELKIRETHSGAIVTRTVSVFGDDPIARENRH